MEEIKIEKGIPVPEGSGRGCPKGAGKIQILLKEMSAGDSVLVDKKQYHSIYAVAKRLKIKTMGRRQSDGKHRVWKLATEEK